MEDSLIKMTTYHEIIDQLVRETRSQSACATRATDNAPFPAESEQPAFNRLLASLDAEQRTLLAETLRQERHSAIHDVLAVWSWWIECRGVGLSENGTPMPVGLSGMGLHGDYVGRANDWAWPEGES